MSSSATVMKSVGDRLEKEQHDIKVDCAELEVKKEALSKQAAELQALARVRKIIPGACADDHKYCADCGVADENEAMAVLTERWKADYRNHGTIRAEFDSVAEFVSFKKHEAIGDARILGEK